MERSYAPRTVAIVALASLVLGFVIVFGGGLLLMHPRGRSGSSNRTASASTGGFADDAAPAVTDAGYLAGPVDDDSGPTAASTVDAGAGGTAATATPEPTQAAGITIGATSISRCFNPGPPTPIRGADCDRLTDLDAHITSRATQISACARSGAHGRLGLVMDFRFSTSYANGWGSPTSNIPNPGGVAACVKNAIFPLPFSNIRHQHDRYLVIVPIDW